MNGRHAPDREIREIIREEPVMRARILDLLMDGPHTVPEIADAIGAPTHEVVFWVMGMRRYGWLIEVKATPEGFSLAKYSNFKSKNPNIPVNVVTYDRVEDKGLYQVWPVWGI